MRRGGFHDSSVFSLNDVFLIKKTKTGRIWNKTFVETSSTGITVNTDFANLV